MSEPHQRWSAGDKLGRFTIVSELSSEGPRLLAEGPDGRVEIAILSKAQAEISSVARKLSRVRDAGLVNVLDVGAASGADFVVIEHVPGRSLAELVAGAEPLTAERGAAWLREIAEALAAAHDAGVAHGRLDARAIWIDETDHARVGGWLDSGDAEAASEAADQRAWAELGQALSEALSPEQRERVGPVLARASEPGGGFATMRDLLAAIDHPDQAASDAGMARRASAQPVARGLPWMPIAIGGLVLAGGLWMMRTLDADRLVEEAEASASASSRTLLGLNDAATKRDERDSSLPRPLVGRCREGQTPACAAGELAWCDASGARLACCSSGRVGEPGGGCGCAPGGTSVQASASACPAATAAPAAQASALADKHKAAAARCAKAAAGQGAEVPPFEVSFRVAPGGAVYDAKLSETARADVRACVMALLARSKAEPPADGDLEVRFSVP